jgi:hypothetical protein
VLAVSNAGKLSWHQVMLGFGSWWFQFRSPHQQPCCSFGGIPV